MKINSSPKPDRVIALSFFVMIILSSIWLLFISFRESTLNARQNFWTVSFIAPIDDTLDFKIENYTPQTAFHWSAAAGKDKPFAEGDVTINPGNASVIPLNFKEAAQRVTIKVSHQQESQEIYKTF